MNACSDKKVYPLVSTDYELLEEVGHGVSATVYRAICTPFKEVVAIKSLDLERCNSNLEDIRREAQTMSLIDHPNVVKAYCSFMVGQFLWVVMPYMAGGSCEHIMKTAFSDGLEEPIIATLLKEILKALDYLHRNGHIHRDVKAGNILVDAYGGVKLADFGVSACMFDRGDRQRSRITFVGTPCWMAPEVMEQLHGYDFKADIWSFGITALELAHGHAPFSKYPPMKVLLMTLQNAPPGLDYERDKRFSKSFKEMIAICLVKNPAKRPSAEKLLKHSFFKRAKSRDFVARRILDGLPPLWERVKALKVKDATRLAQNKMAFVEKEERSQNEYRRGVSGWNFDIEDLKAQAAMIHDDEGPYAYKHEDDMLRANECTNDDIETFLDHSSSRSSPVAGIDLIGSSQGCKSLFMYRQDDETKEDKPLKEFRSGPLPTPMLCRPVDAPKHVSAPLFSRTKEAKFIGRSNVLEEDLENEISCCSEDDAVVNRQSETDYERDELGRERTCEQQYSQMRYSSRKSNIQGRDNGITGRRSSSGPLLSNVNASPCSLEVSREKHSQQSCRWPEDCLYDDRQGKRGSSGPLASNGAVLDYRSCNGFYKSSGTGYKDIPEEKLKGSLIQKKGRFSVTSEDPEHREAFPQATNATLFFVQNGNSNTVPVAAVLPHLQSLCNNVAAQQDIISNLLSSLNPGQGLKHNGSLPSRSGSFGTIDHSLQSWSGRECSLLHEVAGLQLRIATLTDELQAAKLRNVQLENQLSEILCKEEEDKHMKKGS